MVKEMQVEIDKVRQQVRWVSSSTGKARPGRVRISPGTHGQQPACGCGDCSVSVGSRGSHPPLQCSSTVSLEESHDSVANAFFHVLRSQWCALVLMVVLVFGNVVFGRLQLGITVSENCRACFRMLTFISAVVHCGNVRTLGSILS